MKTFSIVFAFAVAAVALQAEEIHPRHDFATAPEVELRVMAEPLHRIVMTAFVLPDLQPELGLSAQQVVQLRQMRKEMLDKGAEFFNRLAARHKELDGMLTPGTSKGEFVKKTLEQIAILRADRLYVVYQAEARMLIPLSEQQRKELSGLSPRDLHRALISRLNAEDLSRMRELLDGEHTLMHETR